MQVQVSEAVKLKSAKPDAVLVIITNMNHLFKEIKGGLIENQKFPLPSLKIYKFIKDIRDLGDTVKADDIE